MVTYGAQGYRYKNLKEPLKALIFLSTAHQALKLWVSQTQLHQHKASVCTPHHQNLPLLSISFPMDSIPLENNEK